MKLARSLNFELWMWNGVSKTLWPKIALPKNTDSIMAKYLDAVMAKNVASAQNVAVSKTTGPRNLASPNLASCPNFVP
ncbi:MAG: hypothetical protein F4053_13670 [Proteobacteria bacterium]|nr:hypothetical protein [Pseudomonadota bacterium]